MGTYMYQCFCCGANRKYLKGAESQDQCDDNLLRSPSQEQKTKVKLLVGSDEKLILVGAHGNGFDLNRGEERQICFQMQLY